MMSGSPPGIGRRRTLAGAAASALAGCTPGARPDIAVPAGAPVEYIVVGSGAGGGPLACNLARAGHKVMVIEAGGTASDARLLVPVLHGLATEDPAIRWDYFVRHYTDDAQQRRDSKLVADRDGIWYPRAGTLGGCTTHNAMITLLPSDSDWDDIAALTGDASWRAAAMHAYFERLEQCRYQPRLLGDPGGHGFDGWLTTSLADPALLLGDDKLQRIVAAAAARAGLARTAADFFASALDPNDRRFDWSQRQTLSNIPLATRDGRRRGTRELLLETAQALPANLLLKTDTLVTRVLFEGTRAVGVEVLEAPRVYRADPAAAPIGPEPAQRRPILATREVILCAGAFNSPQILKLSGIGPREELARFGIPLVADRPGVGENLQDRYEVGVVTRMRSDFALLAPCTFQIPAPGAPPPDACFAEWQQGRGPYTTNGTVIGVARRSAASLPNPDLFIFGLPSDFHGYFPGYSKAITEKDHFTWAILKAHTQNRAGSVRLRSADPRDTPAVNFRSFEDGQDFADPDMQAVMDGVAYVRDMNRALYGGLPPIAAAEMVPGDAVRSPDDVRRFVADEAWGHHASCSNRIGATGDPMAVVDSRFRVQGVQALRVVDASVFPRIPGFFIVTPIYMVSEKASDAILADAQPA